MSATAAVIFAVTVVALACGAVAAIGLWVQSHYRKRAPDRGPLRQVSPTGLALIGCFTLALVVGMAARKLAPESVLGSFLNTERGFLLGMVGAWLAFTVAAGVLHFLGHPLYGNEKGGDV